MSDTFNLDTLQAEADYQPFTFVLDGEQRELPHIQTLSTEQALRIDRGDTAGVIHDVAGGELGDRIMKLPAFATQALFDRWMLHAGLKSGESAASSSS